MRLSIHRLSVVLMAMPVASGQAADLLLNQSISHGAAELTPVSPHMCGLRLNPMMQVGAFSDNSFGTGGWGKCCKPQYGLVILTSDT